MTLQNQVLESHYSPSYELARSQDPTSGTQVHETVVLRQVQDEVIARMHEAETIDGVAFIDEHSKTKDRTLVALAVWDLIDHHVIGFQGDRREKLAFVPQPVEFGPSSGEY
jgi:hypothetical protein